MREPPSGAAWRGSSLLALAVHHRYQPQDDFVRSQYLNGVFIKRNATLEMKDWPADKSKTNSDSFRRAAQVSFEIDPKSSSAHHDQSEHRQGCQDEHGFKGSESHDALRFHPERDCS